MKAPLKLSQRVAYLLLDRLRLPHHGLGVLRRGLRARRVQERGNPQRGATRRRVRGTCPDQAAHQALQGEKEDGVAARIQRGAMRTVASTTALSRGRPAHAGTTAAQ